MKTAQARNLGAQIATLVHETRIDAAYALLAPVLAEKTSFPMLRRIAAPLGPAPLEATNALVARVAEAQTIGGWVIIGEVLRQQLARDRDNVLAQCRRYIILGDVWHAADTLGEAVLGGGLVDDFEATLTQLRAWLDDDNAWVRRAVGTGGHFWAKRSRGNMPERAESLLHFLAPRFDEWEMDAVKGIGWGFKTLGRYYPDLVTDYLIQELLPHTPRYRALMLRKATTYLSAAQKARVAEAAA